MKLPTALLHDLETLDASLDESSTLATQFDEIVRALVESVPTLCALSITVTIDEYPLSLSVVAGVDMTHARASIAVMFPRGASAGYLSELVAHATEPDAFVDLARDAFHRGGIHPGSTTLDAHLDDGGFNGPSSLEEGSLINQAVGVLMNAGHSPGTARLALTREAAFAGHTVASYASSLIAAVLYLRSSTVNSTA